MATYRGSYGQVSGIQILNWATNSFQDFIFNTNADYTYVAYVTSFPTGVGAYPPNTGRASYKDFAGVDIQDFRHSTHFNEGKIVLYGTVQVTVFFISR